MQISYHHERTTTYRTFRISFLLQGVIYMFTYCFTGYLLRERLRAQLDSHTISKVELIAILLVLLFFCLVR